MGYELGEYIEGKGVYMGTDSVLRNQGITQKFNVFATPDNFYIDNREVLTFEFEDAVDFIGSLECLINHDGVAIKSEEDLADAVKSGSYDGQWILPNYRVMKNVLAKNKEAGEFKGSVVKSAFNSFEGPEYAWVLKDGNDVPEEANVFCLDTERFLNKMVDDKPEASIRVIRLEPTI